MAHLPDLVINEIIRRVTTKTAVCMSFLSKQWQDILPSLPMLDFDEGGDPQFDTDDNDFVQHKKFINILQYYLGLCEKDRRQAKKPTPLDKFRLRMRRYSSKDASMIYKLLSYSIEREVKELDISLGGSFTVKKYYYLCRTNLLNAKTLTTLNLEYVRMKTFDRFIDPIDYSISLRLLPCLKTMSLKNVHFDPDAILFFVWECPYIEHLSLTSCSFDEFESQGIQITSPTLKSLEIKNCEASRVELYDVEDLESLTIISSEFHLTGVVLKGCLKLKQVNIEASYLESFSLSGECDNVNAIIDAPALYWICYKAGLDSKFSLNTLDLYICHIDPFKGELPFDEPWKYFQKLKDCLQQFVSSKEMILCADHFEDLTFPEDFRNTLASPILPNLTYVELVIRNPPTYETAKQELNDSLYWMAPAIKGEPYYRSYVF